MKSFTQIYDHEITPMLESLPYEDAPLLRTISRGDSIRVAWGELDQLVPTSRVVTTLGELVATTSIAKPPEVNRANIDELPEIVFEYDNEVDWLITSRIRPAETTGAEADAAFLVMPVGRKAYRHADGRCIRGRLAGAELERRRKAGIPRRDVIDSRTDTMADPITSISDYELERMGQPYMTGLRVDIGQAQEDISSWWRNLGHSELPPQIIDGLGIGGGADLLQNYIWYKEGSHSTRKSLIEVYLDTPEGVLNLMLRLLAKNN